MLKGNTARECLGTTDIGGSADTRKELVVVIKTHVLVLGHWVLTPRHKNPPKIRSASAPSRGRSKRQVVLLERSHNGTL